MIYSKLSNAAGIAAADETGPLERLRKGGARARTRPTR
jgi:hypothetical protein